MTRLKAPRLIQETGIRPARMARAFLAEDYDGIGQYVKIALSRGAVTTALQARVSAGDFGGGRFFPVGTPVVISSYHGQIEVLSLGNQPGCGCGDCFKRSETSGWGTIPAPLGLEWQPRTGSVNQNRFSVDGGYGRVDSSLPEGDTNPLQMIDLGSNGISIPFEVLVKFQFEPAVGSINSWDLDPIGIGTAVPFNGTDVFSGVFGSSTSSTGIGTTDERAPGASNSNNNASDFGTAPALTDLYYRMLIDEFGTYCRIWRAADTEPTTTAAGGIPSTGGRGETWHAWQVSTGPRTTYDFRYFYLQTDRSRAGHEVTMLIDTICFISGISCSNGGCPTEMGI